NGIAGLQRNEHLLSPRQEVLARLLVRHLDEGVRYELLGQLADLHESVVQLHSVLDILTRAEDTDGFPALLVRMLDAPGPRIHDQTCGQTEGHRDQQWVASAEHGDLRVKCRRG